MSYIKKETSYFCANIVKPCCWKSSWYFCIVSNIRMRKNLYCTTWDHYKINVRCFRKLPPVGVFIFNLTKIDNQNSVLPEFRTWLKLLYHSFSPDVLKSMFLHWSQSPFYGRIPYFSKNLQRFADMDKGTMNSEIFAFFRRHVPIRKGVEAIYRKVFPSDISLFPLLDRFCNQQ